jgi:hypothetical protein
MFELVTSYAIICKCLILLNKFPCLARSCLLKHLTRCLIQTNLQNYFAPLFDSYTISLQCNKKLIYRKDKKSRCLPVRTTPWRHMRKWNYEITFPHILEVGVTRICVFTFTAHRSASEKEQKTLIFIQ